MFNFNPKLDKKNILVHIEVNQPLHRSVGGGWSEALHAGAALRNLAEVWAERCGLASPRICPFCRAGVGTPRHAVMACAQLSPIMHRVRDAVESTLREANPTQDLVAAGEITNVPDRAAAAFVTLNIFDELGRRVGRIRFD